MELPQRIKRWREHRGLSRTDLARRIGVHMEAVIQWEDGSTTPTTKNVQKLVEALDTELGEFYSATYQQLPKAKAA